MRATRLLKHTFAFAGLGLLFAGCVEHEREPRVYRRPVREEIYVAPPPPRYEERVVVEERYEPAPREAIVTYEEDLRPYGQWVETPEYGRCWTPRERPSGWRPYTVGHWVNTSDGWCWNSEGPEEQWGVVTYHYGRWYEHPRHGWLWVPGTTWAPAWVAWREGGGYSGWAPLPPTVVVRDRVDAVYIDRYVPADRYVYVESRYVGEPRVYSHVVRNDVTIVRQTTNITNITVINNRVVNRGVEVAHVERSAGRRYETVRVEEATSASEARRLRAEGRPVAYVPTTVRKADEEYRQRVQRRAEDDAAAQRDRVERRNTDASAAKGAEHDRAVRRDQDEAAANKAEHDRAVRRDQEEAAAKAAERDRVARRETDAQKAERLRVERRTQDAAAERDRVARRETDAQKAERERITRRAQDDAAAKAAERDRVVRRQQDSKPAPAAAPPAVSDKQAEHDRAVRREQEAKAAADAAARSRTPAKDPAAAAAAEKQAEHDRAVRRAEEARQADERAKAKGGAPAGGAPTQPPPR
jgi:hypothetical protein